MILDFPTFGRQTIASFIPVSSSKSSPHKSSSFRYFATAFFISFIPLLCETETGKN